MTYRSNMQDNWDINSDEWSMYFHIPYCEHRCNYCDFFTTASSDTGVIKNYLSYLSRELDIFLKFSVGQDITVKSIYFGGGTPSYVPTEAITGIVNQITSSCSIADSTEITVEMNPKSALREKLEIYKKSGINRISLGVQSLQSGELSSLERIHSTNECFETVRAARETGFNNISIDVMFGIPGQTMNSWMDTLEGVLEMEPEHISFYALMLERDTKMTKLVDQGKIILPEDEVTTEKYRAAIKKLNSYSYEHYEVSNCALPGYQSQHNSRYWSGHSYKGFGMSAHSFHHPERSWNTCNYKVYFDSINNCVLPTSGSEQLTELQQMNEEIMLRLRMKEGLNRTKFQKRFGTQNTDTLFYAIEHLIDDASLARFMRLNSHSISLTTEGLFVSDSIISHLLFPEKSIKVAKNVP